MALCQLQGTLIVRTSQGFQTYGTILKSLAYHQKQACMCLRSRSVSSICLMQSFKTSITKSMLLSSAGQRSISLQPTKAYSTDQSEDTASLETLSCDYEEVKDLLQKGKAFFVDVREPKELVNDGRIPGAVNIPLNDVGAALEMSPEKFKEKYGREKPSPDDPNVIFSCRKGVRATSAMQTAHSKGYHAARFYRGSFCDWEERGGEVIKG
uniref:Rhodanese domain-containing protein n=1 Tax=Amblyomma maculatum TaxID=34609 RepID=G3MNV4_AMBMU